MLDALCEYLLEKPNLYRDEIVLFLLDEFNTREHLLVLGER